MAKTEKQKNAKSTWSMRNTCCSPTWFEQSVAVLLIGVLNLMTSIPFGVSYFPIDWPSENFPTNKESLGIRMFLFATLVGQIVLAFQSKFNNAIALQMVENVPFCHSLAAIVIQHQGQTPQALSTLLILFAVSSIMVGFTFYALGKLEWGRVVYFFPSHVLVGCIAGIGIFLIRTGFEITMNQPLEEAEWAAHFHLLLPLIVAELMLRLLLTLSAGKYPLLMPLFFFAMTPAFYATVAILGYSPSQLDPNYFFSLSDSAVSSENNDIWDIWAMIDFTTFSWEILWDSFPTILSLVAFSLIHVPINIPAFALSIDAEVDMNAELIAHGYSNAISGFFGGLQNYMTYSDSVLYAKSGGHGTTGSLAVAALTAAAFVIGPNVASYIPRCIAGTLLLDIGINLFMEGVRDSYANFDYLEYSAVWFILIVMNVWGMTAGIMAGVLSALLTYALQSITYLNPIRGTMSAATLRSSAFNRPKAANEILKLGRSRIFVVQLQGHIFFGNVVNMTEQLVDILTQKQETDEEPIIVIIDFTLVVGMDSSAAQAIRKLKKTIHQRFHVRLTILVTGSGKRFRTHHNLSGEVKEISKAALPNKEVIDGTSEKTPLLQPTDVRTTLGSSGFPSTAEVSTPTRKSIELIPSDHVCEDIDTALMLAENVLIALENPSLLKDDAYGPVSTPSRPFLGTEGLPANATTYETALYYLANLCPGASPTEIEELMSFWNKELYEENDILWEQGSPGGGCAKLMVKGMMVSELGNETTEFIYPGAIFGEFGLVMGTERLSTVRCVSPSSTVYNLSLEKWEVLTKEHPHLARLMDMITLRYLANRVQRVSNRIFDPRSLPV